MLIQPEREHTGHLTGTSEFVFYGVILGLLILFSWTASSQLAERTRWRERKFYERRITFQPTIRLAVTVFCLIQVLRFAF